MADYDPWDDPWDEQLDSLSEADSDDIPYRFAGPEDYTKLSAEEAGAEFANLLLDLWHMKALSSKNICLLAFWGSRAGATGYCSKLGFQPVGEIGGS